MTKKVEPTTARRMPISRTLAARSRKRLLLLGAPEELDEQRAADVESLVHMGFIWAFISMPLAGNVAQDCPQLAGGEDEQTAG